MLILTRAEGESVEIHCGGRLILVTLLMDGRKGRETSIGFTADRDIKIYRSEIAPCFPEPLVPAAIASPETKS